MTRIAILGAGPAGLSLAYHLLGTDIEVDVYDQSEKPGGLATSFLLWDKKVELGPHFIRAGGCIQLDKMISDLLPPNDYTTYERNTSILLDGVKFSYPPKPMELLKHLGVIEVARSCFSFTLAQLRNNSPRNTAEQIFIKSMGRRLYSRLVKRYSEKLWGLSPDSLHPAYAQNLLPFSGAGNILKKLMGASPAANSSTALWKFHNGFDSLWNGAFYKISNKYKVYMASRISAITHSNGAVNGLISNGRKENYDLIISTIPASVLLSLLGHEISSPKSKPRSALLIYFLVSGNIKHKETCLYLYSPEVSAVRLTNFGEIDEMPDQSVLMLEYWLASEEPDLREEAFKSASQELLLINESPLVIHETHSVFLKGSYRIPNHDLFQQNATQLEALEQYRNLMILGRNNSINFNYGMEQAVREGAEMAESLNRLFPSSLGATKHPIPANSDSPLLNRELHTSTAEIMTNH